MSLISMKCPSCGGEVQIDDSHEFCFCIYCGNKLIIQPETRQNVRIDHSEKIDALTKLMVESMKAEKDIDVLQYAERILDEDPSNAFAWYVKGCFAENMDDALYSWNIALSFVKDEELENVIRNRIEQIGIESTLVKMTFTYPNIYCMSNVRISVYIDDSLVCKLGNNDKVPVKVRPGRHVLKYHLEGKAPPLVEEIDVRDGLTVKIGRSIHGLHTKYI